MFNKVILVGNLTRDIELRYLGSGSALANTAIATNRRFTVNGEKKEEVCFIDITFWGRTAEIANQYLKKGSKVLIEGRLKFDQWQDQNGQNRSKHSVTVETMQMLGEATQGGMQGGGMGQSRNFQSNQSQQNYNQQSYGGNSYGSNSYGGDSSYGSSANYGGSNQGYSQQQKSNFQDNYDNYSDYDGYNEEIPEIDVDADMNDEELPF
ncbi:MAG: single-stranded DNA-binding protein [Campylobacteraceae bacterium]|nr:single-stranded DNA-binding protein [Campylobacteraceae bacterium]